MPPEIAQAPLLVASFAALALAELLLGVPGLLARVPRGAATPAVVAGLVSAALLLTSGPKAFDPYWLAIFAATSWVALAALASIPSGSPLGPTDIAVWLLLWIPFDLRWNYTLFPRGEDNAYNWWALYLTVLGAIGWGRLRELPGFDYRLLPRLRDLPAALLGFTGILVTCVAPGFAMGFLHWHPPEWKMLAEAAIAGPAIFLTIALPEELFFRCVLQAGLERRMRRPWQAMAIASLAFGLMHWNNAESTHGELSLQLTYFVLASIGGVFYGLAYRIGGSILAPALAHAGADLAWHLFFQ